MVCVCVYMYVYVCAVCICVLYVCVYYILMLREVPCLKSCEHKWKCYNLHLKNFVLDSKKCVLGPAEGSSGRVAKPGGQSSVPGTHMAGETSLFKVVP